MHTNNFFFAFYTMFITTVQTTIIIPKNLDDAQAKAAVTRQIGETLLSMADLSIFLPEATDALKRDSAVASPLTKTAVDAYRAELIKLHGYIAAYPQQAKEVEQNYGSLSLDKLPSSLALWGDSNGHLTLQTYNEMRTSLETIDLGKFVNIKNTLIDNPHTRLATGKLGGELTQALATRLDEYQSEALPEIKMSMIGGYFTAPDGATPLQRAAYAIKGSDVLLRSIIQTVGYGNRPSSSQLDIARDVSAGMRPLVLQEAFRVREESLKTPENYENFEFTFKSGKNPLMQDWNMRNLRTGDVKTIILETPRASDLAERMQKLIPGNKALQGNGFWDVLLNDMTKTGDTTTLVKKVESLLRHFKAGPKNPNINRKVIKRKPLMIGIDRWKIDSKAPEANMKNVLEQWDNANRAAIRNALIVPEAGEPSEIERVLTSSMTGSSAAILPVTEKKIKERTQLKKVETMLTKLAKFDTQSNIDWSGISDSFSDDAKIKPTNENANELERILESGGYFDNIDRETKRKRAYKFARGMNTIEQQRETFFQANRQILDQYGLKLKSAAMTLKGSATFKPTLNTIKSTLATAKNKATSIKNSLKNVKGNVAKRITSFRAPIIVE